MPETFSVNGSECIAAEARARRHLQASPVRTSRRLTSSQGGNQTQPEEFKAKQGASGG
jgi:hypothetical protein